MSPWSSAETETEKQSDGEALERDLFARRARALGAEAVPSLEAVLRAAGSSREARDRREKQGARGRAFVAMALAAACMTAALTRIPRADGPAKIVAEIDASAAAPAVATIVEAPPAEECTMNEDLVASEERACFAPTAALTPAPLYTPAPSDPPCAPEESCATTTQ